MIMIINEINRLKTEQRPWTETTDYRIGRCDSQMQLLVKKAMAVKMTLNEINGRFYRN